MLFFSFFTIFSENGKNCQKTHDFQLKRWRVKNKKIQKSNFASVLR